ncbi:MAG: hypothetical protein U9R19_04800 [Bacteroidota bacterium]|nr:hypothetical protein [Bacteroidota bacterium]
MKTLNRIILALTIIGLSIHTGFSQTAEEIIGKHIDAHGGMENWEAVKSIKLTGKFTAFGESKAFTEIKARPDRFYASFSWGQHVVEEARNGSVYWTINPWFDMFFARKTNSVEANIINQKSEFCTPFFNYKERGYVVEYLGKEEVEGIGVFKLELTRPGQQPETWYINSQTYLEYMYTSMWCDFASPTMQETWFEDFRKVGNIIIPYYTERTFSIRHRVIEIEKVELNIETNDEMFDIPLSDAMKKLKVLEGEWNVSVDVFRRGAWTNADSTTSSIKYLKNKNLLQETISYVNFFPVEKAIQWSYNTDSEKYRVSVFTDFYSDTKILQGNFSGDTLLIDNTEISFSKDEGQEKSLSKYIISNITEQGFLLEIAGSRDDGENWAVQQKFTYTRRE